MDIILEKKDKNKIVGQIYKILNIKTNKIYVGQARSHRLNKKKYRPFGYIGRFNDHLSEAINNTKKKQCTYLNNAIRKYGKESFKVELIYTCNIPLLDKYEKKFIKDLNSLFPHGYNLTKGGNEFSVTLVDNNSEINAFKKRGRDFGYKHKESTKNKMSQRLKEISKIQSRDIKFRRTLNKYYNKRKIKILSSYKKLSHDIIKPVKNKKTGDIHDYVIRIEGRKLTLRGNMNLNEKINTFKFCIDQAIEMQKVISAKIPEKEMDNPQPSP